MTVTFNSAQQERLLAAVERVADALEQHGQFQRGYFAGFAEGQARIEPTDPQTTKDPRQ